MQVITEKSKANAYVHCYIIFISTIFIAVLVVRLLVATIFNINYFFRYIRERLSDLLLYLPTRSLKIKIKVKGDKQQTRKRVDEIEFQNKSFVGMKVPELQSNKKTKQFSQSPIIDLKKTKGI